MLYFWKEEINAMRYYLLIFLIIIGAILSCERDDICASETETTPKLIIDFYDISNQENAKSVNHIWVQGVGNSEPLGDYTGNNSEASIELPLKTDAVSTQFSIYKDFAINNNGTPSDPNDDYVTGNEDIITITYNPEQVYVSRACGYKTIYKNVVVSVTNDGDNWIQLIQSVDDIQTVENEREAHFKIYH